MSSVVALSVTITVSSFNVDVVFVFDSVVLVRSGYDKSTRIGVK